MNLATRALRRSRKLLHSLADLRRTPALRSRARPPRTIEPIDDLAAGPVLVVVAHPDDEAIAAAILLSRAPRASVICVSDGAPRRAFYAERAGFHSWLDYADARRAETDTALRLLRPDLERARNLGVADQEVAFQMAALARYFVDVFAEFPVVVTHAYEGGHPDHDSVAFSVHAACALMSRAGRAPPTVVEAPLYSALGEEFIHQAFLPHDDAGPELELGLSDAETDLKRRMFDCYVTQRNEFGKFRADQERFRLAPRYHFAAPPSSAPVGFDRYGWPINARRWRRAAWDAMRELDLLDELA